MFTARFSELPAHAGSVGVRFLEWGEAAVVSLHEYKITCNTRPCQLCIVETHFELDG